MSIKTIHTIGYEGCSVEEVLDALELHGVATLVDVRELPLSRKRGLSKTRLGELCAERGLRYVHQRALGNPKAIRKSGMSAPEMMAAYAAHLDDMDAAGTLHPVLYELDVLWRDGPICLMCYEADPATCHRTVAAQRLAVDMGAVVVDISPGGRDER